MKKIVTQSILMLIGLFAMISCEPNNEFTEAASLQLSKSNVSFEKLGGEASIAITTNQANWTYFSPQEGQWISLSKDGNNLKVKTLPNPEGKDRVGVVMVSAGGASQRIEVTQVAADIVLDINPHELVFQQRGGELKVSVASNTNNWEIKPIEETSWLTLTRAGNIVFIKAESNISDTDRETRLLASSGVKQTELVVKQPGIHKYIMPLLNLEHPKRILEAEIIGRGSILLKYEEPYINSIGGKPITGTVSVSPNCTAFKKLNYLFDVGSENTWSNIVLFAEKWEDIAGTEYSTYLKKEGFTQETANQKADYMTFVNNEKTYKVTIEKRTVGDVITNRVEFERIYKQVPLPTFTEMPTLLHQFLYKYDKKVEDVMDWGKARGFECDTARSKVNPAQVEFLMMTKKNPEGNEPGIIAAWFLCDRQAGKTIIKLDEREAGTLEQYQLIYGQGLNRLMWNTHGPRWIPTLEFEELVKKNGFPQFYGSSPAQNKYTYQDATGMKWLNLIKANIDGIYEGADHVRIQYWEEPDLEDEESASRRRNYDLQEMMSRLK